MNIREQANLARKLVQMARRAIDDSGVPVDEWTRVRFVPGDESERHMRIEHPSLDGKVFAFARGAGLDEWNGFELSWCEVLNAHALTLPGQ